MAKKGKLANDAPEPEDTGEEINTVYGDLITFIAVLFILLFVLSYNEKQDDTFFTQMRIQFGSEEIEEKDAVTAESLFVSKIVGYIKNEALENEAKILVDEQKIKLILTPPVLFDSGYAKLKPQGKKILKGIGDIIKEVRNPIIIEGHTDNIPINTKDFSSNWELSFFRSYEIVKYFMNTYRFPPTQLSALGYGEFKPMYPNDTPENRSKNRRIEINIIRVTKAESENQPPPPQ